MGKKVSATERAEALRAAYEYAKKNKGEDRLTQADIKDAKEALYGKPKKAAGYGAIKDYAELSKGGQIKPVKAVGGILAGMAAGIAPGIIGVGMLAKKKMKKKSSTVSPDDVKYSLEDKNMLTNLYQKATKQEATKMNKGGGMDMGQMPNTVKPRPRGNPGIVETVVGKGGDYIKDLID